MNTPTTNNLNMLPTAPFPSLPVNAPKALQALPFLPEDEEVFPLQDYEEDDPDPLLTSDTVLEMLLDGDLDHLDDDEEEDATVANDNNEKKCMRLSLMVPGDKEAANQALAFVNACNESLGAITSKLGQVQLIPWKCTELLRTTKRWNKIPTDLALAETVLHQFTRFSTGMKGFFRVQITYPSSIHYGSIVEACRAVNVPNQRFVQPAPSAALDPITLGILSMTVPAMERNDIFNQLLCHIFDVEIMGTRWATQNVPGNSKIPDKIPWKARKVLLIEVDRNESEKKNLPSSFAEFFNVLVTPGNGPLLGMSANFTYLPPGWQSSSKIKSKVKRNILAHASFNLGVQEITIGGVRLLNKLPTGQTLLRALLQLPSLTQMTNKDGKTLVGRVFVSFVPTEDPEVWTAYYPTIFESEAESVVAALPQFIEQQWKVKANSFCRSSYIASALDDGIYNHSSRTFVTKDELEENARLQSAGIELILPVDFSAAPTDKFISAEHQRAFAADANDADTADTDLRDKTPVAMKNTVSPSDEVSAMTGGTGSTRSSKAQAYGNAYAKEQVKNVTRQYSAQVTQMREENERLVRLLGLAKEVTPDTSARAANAAIVHATNSPTSRLVSNVFSPVMEKDYGSDDLEEPTAYNSDGMSVEKLNEVVNDELHSGSKVTSDDDDMDGKKTVDKDNEDADEDDDEDDMADDDDEGDNDDEDDDDDDEEDDDDDDSNKKSSLFSHSLSDTWGHEDEEEEEDDDDDTPMKERKVIVLGGDSEESAFEDASVAESSFAPSPPRRKGVHRSAKFSPRPDANKRPSRLNRTRDSTTGSEGLGVGTSD